MKAFLPAYAGLLLLYISTTRKFKRAGMPWPQACCGAGYLVAAVGLWAGLLIAVARMLSVGR